MTNAAVPDWSLSVVSHGHGVAVRRLLASMAKQLDPDRHEILLTLNRPGEDADWVGAWPGPFFQLIRNPRAQGFGANHNAALRHARGRWLAIIDPDLQFQGDPFPRLADALADPHVGIVSTRVRDETGAVADHARRVPTPRRLLRRHVMRESTTYDEVLDREFEPDWVAGLFMAMRRETFDQLGGFDPGFHMYCEDVDLCLRAWNAGMRVQVIPADWVVHPARRQTLKRLQHFLWHVCSLVRLWSSPSYTTFRQTVSNEPRDS